LAADAGLAEIGELLRHRSVTSTAIYARVDIETLRGVALEWPGGERR
jgi:integrase/recombinase XerD